MILNNRSHLLGLQVACTLVVALSFAAPLLAHPGHVTRAEAEYNPKTKSLEISLELDLDDLETALRTATGKRIVLEKAKKLDPMIEDYLKGKIVAKRGKKTYSKIKWVGKELDENSAWIYIELALPKEKGVEGLELSHRVFFEALPQPINTMRIRSGKKQTTLNFTEKSPRHVVSFEKRDQKNKKR